MNARFLSAVASAALFATMAAVPVSAGSVGVGGIGASVGGNSSGGTTAGVSAGGATASASIGGGGGNVASATANTGSNAGSQNGTVGIGTTSGSLVSATQNGSNTNARVNLGGLLGPELSGLVDDTLGTVNGTVNPVLDGINPGGVIPDDSVGGVPPGIGNLPSAFSAMDPAEQMAVRVKCRNVLANPAAYAKNIVALCRMIASL
ncbi:MAG: hypothetical protein ABI399_04070 [Bauldia sp.]